MRERVDRRETENGGEKKRHICRLKNDNISSSNLRVSKKPLSFMSALLLHSLYL
jgi:hypothetical protein